MKEKIVFAGIVLIFLIGVVSAGFLGTFGNIKGLVSVVDPVFYLDSSQDQGGYSVLSLNAIPLEENESIISGGGAITFISPQLGIESFYQSEFKIVFWAKTNTAGNLLQFKVLQIKENFIEEEICGPMVLSINSTEEFQRHEVSCFSDGEISLEPGGYFGLEIKGIGQNAVYWVRTGEEFEEGYTRMEVLHGTEPAELVFDETDSLEREGKNSDNLKFNDVFLEEDNEHDINYLGNGTEENENQDEEEENFLEGENE